MRKLEFELNWDQFKRIQSEIVPVLFTAHQFQLIEKRAKKQKMTPSEKNEFSRAVSKRIRAINYFLGRENQFIYGREKILPERLILARKYLKQFSRKFRNKPIIISGSFLYNQKYHDIDIFIIEKYEKEDFKDGDFHFNFLPESSLNSLFLNSLSRISLSNFELSPIIVKDKITSSQLISKYQEIRQDISQKNLNWLKIDLRDFIIDCYYAGNKIILDSIQLNNLVNYYLNYKYKEKLIKNLFINTLLAGFKNKEIKKVSQKMIQSYREILKEYHFPEHYNPMINTFKEVLDYAS